MFLPQDKPILIGLFCGIKKPNNLDEFLEDFVSEINELERCFEFNGIRLTRKLSAGVCDAPA